MTHCLDRRWGAFKFVMRETTSICVVSIITLTCSLHTSVSAKTYIYYLIVVLVRWIRQKNPEKSLYYIMSGDRVADEQQKTKFVLILFDTRTIFLMKIFLLRRWNTESHEWTILSRKVLIRNRRQDQLRRLSSSDSRKTEESLVYLTTTLLLFPLGVRLQTFPSQ